MQDQSNFMRYVLNNTIAKGVLKHFFSTTKVLTSKCSNKQRMHLIFFQRDVSIVLPA